MREVGLVLGGGAVRGLAHIGVLKVFEAHRIPVGYVIGTSMGGAIGGLYAAGISARELEDIIVNTPKHRLIDVGLRRRGLIAGNGLQQVIVELLRRNGKEGLGIEEFPIPFKAIAVDLMEGSQVVLDRGDFVAALRATTAFPGVFAPLTQDGRMLVDGGVLNNLPVEEMKQIYDGPVIAVDVARQHEKKPPRNMIEVVYRSYSLMTAERKRSSLKLADLVIRPEVGHVAAFDFTKSQECIRAGEEAAERIVNRLKGEWPR